MLNCWKILDIQNFIQTRKKIVIDSGICQNLKKISIKVVGEIESVEGHLWFIIEMTK